jgi:hypothetical protein
MRNLILGAILGGCVAGAAAWIKQQRSVDHYVGLWQSASQQSNTYFHENEKLEADAAAVTAAARKPAVAKPAAVQAGAGIPGAGKPAAERAAEPEHMSRRESAEESALSAADFILKQQNGFGINYDDQKLSLYMECLEFINARVDFSVADRFEFDRQVKHVAERWKQSKSPF